MALTKAEKDVQRVTGCTDDEARAAVKTEIYKKSMGILAARQVRRVLDGEDRKQDDKTIAAREAVRKWKEEKERKDNESKDC